MISIATILLVATAAVTGNVTAVSVPFTLPPGVSVSAASEDGKGWAANGSVKLAFTAAKARLATAIAASGWKHEHSIDLGKDRVLEAWRRGDDELTVMIWRVAPGRSGFSYGLSAKGNSRGKRENAKKED